MKLNKNEYQAILHAIDLVLDILNNDDCHSAYKNTYKYLKTIISKHKVENLLTKKFKNKDNGNLKQIKNEPVNNLHRFKILKLNSNFIIQMT